MMILIFQENKRAFKRYTETYQVEIINNKNLSGSLVISKPAITDLLINLLREKKGFKYVLSTKIMLKERANDNGHKYYTVYFNSLIKTVINRSLIKTAIKSKISFKKIIWKNTKFTRHVG